MKKICAEIIGSAILVLLGNSVVANMMLSKTKGNDDKRNCGWLIITIGWTLAVFISVIISAPYSGAHLNPCITISFAISKEFPWNWVPFYIIAQFIGSIIGSIIVWLLYKEHFKYTHDKNNKLSAFATTPSTNNILYNFFSEILSTFIFILISLLSIKSGSILYAKNSIELGLLEALPGSLILFGVVLSLGGPTGPALNPVRDLGPRIMHSILPIPGKGSSNWNYFFVPFFGPIIGSILATKLYLYLSYFLS